MCKNCASGACEAYVDTIAVNMVINCSSVDCSTADVRSINDGSFTLSYTDDSATPSFTFKQPVTNNKCCQMSFTGPYTDQTSSVIHPELSMAHDTSNSQITITVGSGYVNERKTRNFYIQAQLGTGGPTEWLSYGGSSMFQFTAACGTATTTISEGSWPAGYTATQSVQANNADSAALTRFVLPQYASSNSDCAITTAVISSSGTTLAAMTTLSGPSDDGAGQQIVVPSDISSIALYQFYILNTANGGATWYSSQYSFTVGCVAPLTLSHPASFQSSITGLSILSGSTHSYTFVNPTISPSYCTVSANAIVSLTRNGASQPSTTMVYFDASCSQPCTTVKIDQGMVDQDITFKVRSTASTGETIDSPTITVSSGICGTSSTTISYPSSPTFSLDRSNSIEITGTNPQLTIDKFQSSNSGCPITSYDLYSDSAGSTVHPTMKIAQSTSVLYIHTDATLSLQSTVASYQYYLKVTAAGGATFWAAVSPDSQTQFTFNVICGSSSTVVSQSAYSDSSLSDTQVTARGSNAYFILPVFLSSIPACSITSAQVSKITGSIQVPVSNFVNDAVKVSGEYYVYPSDPTRHDDYQFYVKTFAGTASTFSTSQFELQVGCTTASATATHLSTDQTRYVRDSATDLYSITLPSFSKTWCQVEHIEIKSIQVDGVASASSPIFFQPTCTQPCLYLSVDSTFQTRIYSFVLRFVTSSTQNIYFESSRKTLTLSCGATSTDITSSITTFEYEYLKDNVNNTLQFDAFTCTNPSCCLQALTYKVLASETDSSQVHTELPTPMSDSSTSKMSITLPNTAFTTFEFWILAVNQYNTQLITPKITINIVFDCKLDIITPKVDKLSISKANTALSTNGEFYKYDIEIVQNSEKLYMIDIAERFEKISQNGSCNLSFSIDKVLLGSQQVEQFLYEGIFGMSSAGLFTIKDFTKTFQRFNIYVTASNGLINSTSYNMIDLEITKQDVVLPNVAPYFVEEPKDQFLVLDSTNVTGKATFELPEIVDLNQGDTYEVELTKGQDELFATYDSKSNSITIDKSKAKEGKYDLEIRIVDQYYASSSYSLNITLKRMVRKETTKVFESNEEKQPKKDEFKIEREKEPISVYRSEFTQNGEIIIYFYDILKSLDEFEDLNLTMISNEDYFEVDYKTFVEGYQVGHENVPKLLNWKIVYFGSQFMTLKVNLTNPIMVSTGDEKDLLDIHFKNPKLFQSAYDNERFLKDDFTIYSEVPLQMPSEAEYNVIKLYADSSKSILNVGILLPIFLKVFFSAIAPLIWGTVNNLQLNTNVTAYNKFKIPALIVMLFEKVNETVQLKLQEVPQIKKFINRNVQFAKGIVDKFGVLPIGIIGLLIIILLLKVLEILYRKSLRVQKVVVSIQKKLMWSSVIKFVTTSYFIICLNTLEQVYTLGESDPKTMIMFTLNLCLVIVFPIFTYYFLKKNLSNLEKAKFKEKYGGLYENVYIHKSDQTFKMMVYFLSKRLLIALVTVFCDDLPNIQIGVGIYCTIASLSFTICQRQMVFNYLNWMELSNDVLFMTTNYALFLFTDFIVQPSERYQIAEIYFKTFIGHCIATSLLIIYILIRKVIRKVQYKMKQKEYKKLEEKLQLELVRQRERAEKEEIKEGDSPEVIDLKLKEQETFAAIRFFQNYKESTEAVKAQISTDWYREVDAEFKKRQIKSINNEEELRNLILDLNAGPKLFKDAYKRDTSTQIPIKVYTKSYFKKMLFQRQTYPEEIKIEEPGPNEQIKTLEQKQTIKLQQQALKDQIMAAQMRENLEGDLPKVEQQQYASEDDEPEQLQMEFQEQNNKNEEEKGDDKEVDQLPNILDLRHKQFQKLDRLMTKVENERQTNKSLDHSNLVANLKLIQKLFPDQFSLSLKEELKQAHFNNKVQNKRVKKLFKLYCPGKTFYNDTDLYYRLRHIYFRNVFMQINRAQFDMKQEIGFEDDFECLELDSKDLEELRGTKKIFIH